MSEPFHGPIGLMFRRPGLCLAMAGSFLIVISLANLSVIWLIVGPGIKLVRLGMYNWPSIGLIPIVLIVIAGIVGLATGTAMLIAAAYLSGRRTKSRLFGCALVGVGLMTVAVGIHDQDVLWLPGVLLVGIGGVILRRSAECPALLGSG